MGDLGTDTAVEGRDGRYTARLSRDWEIWGPNGGYVASIALRAAGAHSRFDRPASSSATSSASPTSTRVDIEVTTLREAKRAESIRVSMTQHGQPIFDAMVWAVGDVGGLEHDVTAMPEAPDPESLPSTRSGSRELGIEAELPVLGQLRPALPTGSWIDDWENRPADRAGVQPVVSATCPRSTFDDPGSTRAAR